MFLFAAIVLLMASLFGLGLFSALRSVNAIAKHRTVLICTSVASFSLLLLVALDAVRALFFAMVWIGEENSFIAILVTLGWLFVLLGVLVLLFEPLMRATEQ